MDALSTIARPYAAAAFAQAKDEDKLSLWSEMLQFLAAVIAADEMSAIVTNPKIHADTKADLVLDICQGRMTETSENFVRVLAANGRLALAPEIAELYEGMRSEAEGQVDVKVTSAYALKPDYANVIAEAMEKRLGRKVNLDSEIDRDIIAGVVIRAGDLVIDLSARGRLQAMAAELVA